MSSNPYVLAVLSGGLAMSPSPAAGSDTRAVAAATRALTDLTASSVGWYVVNDNVMGGRSEGDFVRTGNVIEFRGSTNTDGGGFSSIRTRPIELDLGDHDGIRVRVRGDGRRYTWRLVTDARWRGREVGYWADFETRKDEWIVADIPFASFVPQWRGRELSGPVLDPGTIRGMGLMIYDKKAGPFSLLLGSVQAYRAMPRFSLADERWRSRVLVTSAPSIDDPQLVAQLEDVAATREEFEERDMLLVVLLDSPDSRAGDRPLSAEEARTVRRAAVIEAGAFAVRLVGKDGGIKRSATSPMAMTDVYALIDTMPMREAEMQRSKRD